MRTSLILPLFLLLPLACQGQSRPEPNPTDRPVGGPCEGCEALHEWGGTPLAPTDTLPGFAEGGERLVLRGVIYQQDGKTPAKGVILYIYHTDPQGHYPMRGDEEGWGRRHGYLRGWIKTGPDGRYTFYTRRPGSYPERSGPAHIHLTVKEPGLQAYYLDDVVFADDPLLPQQPTERAPRGGSGVLQLRKQGGYWLGERNIVLGLNIPDYD